MPSPGRGWPPPGPLPGGGGHLLAPMAGHHQRLFRAPSRQSSTPGQHVRPARGSRGLNSPAGRSARARSPPPAASCVGLPARGDDSATMLTAISRCRPRCESHGAVDPGQLVGLHSSGIAVDGIALRRLPIMPSSRAGLQGGQQGLLVVQVPRVTMTTNRRCPGEERAAGYPPPPALGGLRERTSWRTRPVVEHHHPKAHPRAVGVGRATGRPPPGRGFGDHDGSTSSRPRSSPGGRRPARRPGRGRWRAPAGRPSTPPPGAPSPGRRAQEVNRTPCDRRPGLPQRPAKGWLAARSRSPAGTAPPQIIQAGGVLPLRSWRLPRPRRASASRASITLGFQRPPPTVRRSRRPADQHGAGVRARPKLCITTPAPRLAPARPRPPPPLAPHDWSCSLRSG